MKIEIDIHHEMADIIVAESLKDSYYTLLDDKSRRSEGIGYAIFETDADADLVEIDKHLDAFRMVMSWYGVKVDDLGE